MCLQLVDLSNLPACSIGISFYLFNNLWLDVIDNVGFFVTAFLLNCHLIFKVLGKISRVRDHAVLVREFLWLSLDYFVA